MTNTTSKLKEACEKRKRERLLEKRGRKKPLPIHAEKLIDGGRYLYVNPLGGRHKCTAMVINHVLHILFFGDDVPMPRDLFHGKFYYR